MAASANTRRRTNIVLFASVCMVGLLIFSLPTVMLFFFGMLPSFVAYIIDRSKEKYAMCCVASMNFCGVFPYLTDLWFESHTIMAATNTLADVFALVIMFGGAAFGWVLYTVVPPIVGSFLSVIAKQRVAALRSQQRKLIEEWGEAVAHQADAASVAAATAAQPLEDESAEQAENGGESPSIGEAGNMAENGELPSAELNGNGDTNGNGDEVTPQNAA